PPRLSSPWLHAVQLRPAPGRLLTVVAASRRSPGDGGKRGRKKRGRRATEADQEDGLSVGSEMETKSSTPRATVNDGSVKPALEASMTPKDSAIRRVALVVIAAVLFGVSIALKDGVEKASEYFAGFCYVTAICWNRVCRWTISLFLFWSSSILKCHWSTRIGCFLMVLPEQ
uniref:Uncharacterized protein n=1 Tax=Aegilops tauschii subsp. strangulata TaxID=200361 RepID=A0A452XRR3_AEGTS